MLAEWHDCPYCGASCSWSVGRDGAVRAILCLRSCRRSFVNVYRPHYVYPLSYIVRSDTEGGTIKVRPEERPNARLKNLNLTFSDFGATLLSEVEAYQLSLGVENGKEGP